MLVAGIHGHPIQGPKQIGPGQNSIQVFVQHFYLNPSMATTTYILFYYLTLDIYYLTLRLLFRIGLEEAKEVERGKMLNIFGDFRHETN